MLTRLRFVKFNHDPARGQHPNIGNFPDPNDDDQAEPKGFH
jgi:hypothetical protein